MSKNTRTVQVHPRQTPLSIGAGHNHTYEDVTAVNMENGLILYGKNDKILAAYHDRAWESWNVVPDTEKDARDAFPRDSFGRFTKRK